MSERCTECGAVLPEGRTCQSLFDEFLALEFSNPGYGQVHFLTVACFMTQHGRYSDEALVWVRAKLRTYLENDLTGTELRQIAAEEIAAADRKWNPRRPADAPPLPKVAWSMTISDVAQQMQDAETYCLLVKQWGRVTLEEMGAMLYT
ncbi:DUF5946 family protein [Paenibacillus alkalitolerans]|uniref:DUF5946 family protein n=1 Tax=Paenibacillus alkalitolerans TaxID=2799335 RepID=UPI0018F3D55D|nr:DUF5946 family protein [Paenibacillus alkalitolerans]